MPGRLAICRNVASAAPCTLDARTALATLLGCRALIKFGTMSLSLVATNPIASRTVGLFGSTDVRRAVRRRSDFI